LIILENPVNVKIFHILPYLSFLPFSLPLP
jgi:hypothetical protein